ncbi:GNAT family N-acetyltransferase [uncultured Tateyamaria sp.]|uniref:GNAT family N-acetyltransferase n=1 Tax=Tateyamaria sp. 1078 TaxID=3417464 RepID=UPI0026172C92|nr:GNAT family N-acetyltransferase [uncultured Tateyamaria sp.]
MTPKIRQMAPRDTGAVLEMISALAAFHEDVAQIDEATLTMMTFGPLPCLKVLVAEGEAGLVGYAALMPTARLHFGKFGLEMHHLFVKPRVRGSGVGRALVAACKAEGLRRGCHYISVGAHPDNTAAGAFYEKRGFERHMMTAPRFRMGLDQPLT